MALNDDNIFHTYGPIIEIIEKLWKLKITLMTNGI